MGLPDVVIIKGQGGLGRPLPGQDYISGITFFTDVLPSGFTTEDNIKQILSTEQAESLGITADYSDETQGKGTILVTGIGANGDTITPTFILPDGTTVELGTYTKVAGATTATLVATGIKNAINLNSATTGFTATSSTATVTITFKKGLGIYPNSGTPLNTVIVGTIAVTTTNSTVDGVASLLAQWHYHISEYFRLQPQGNIFVGFFPLTAQAWNFNEITEIQAFAAGTIRQIGVYLCNTNNFTSAADINTAAALVQTKCAALDSIHSNLSAIIATDGSTISDLTTLLDQNSNTYNKVSVTIGQDGKALGAAIYAAQGYSITDLGACLGAISLSKVNESQAWVQKFNMTNGVELAVPYYFNGTAVDMVNGLNLATQLNNYRYCFLRTFSGKSGSFWVDNPTSISVSSDYAYINDNRVIDKASRLLYLAYLDQLSAPLQLNSNGTLSDNTVAFFTSLGNTALDEMVRDSELSDKSVTINPAQNVLATNKLIVTVKLLPQGVARHIEINLSFTTAL